ncbi:hypothetical protein [Streptomyces sp. G45]|uniref:hypothetical protein n=1 Tax=Streptomyces sp. G45 TaxID=3406627 RepID=UPI003C18039B
MKPLKAAAVLAGSMAIAGAAAPAFAQEPVPTSLNGGVDAILRQPLAAQPLSTNMLDTENENSVVNAVKQATDALNANGGPTQLLGGLPLAK